MRQNFAFNQRKIRSVFVYKGEATISYVNDEMRNGARTRKYKINGAGLENRGGFLWVNKKGNYFQDAEIDLPDNPDWKSFKLKLLKIEKMIGDEWQAFMQKQF
jgi:hypothetical protein